MLVARIGPWEPRDKAPLYRQFQTLLRAALDRHAFVPDEALPPERDLAEAYGISRVTVRKAIDGLVSDRLLTRRHGAGTFVAARIEKNVSSVTSFTEDMRARGMVASSRWLTRDRGVVTPDEAMALALGPGSTVQRYARVRYADGKSMALEYSTIPDGLIDDPERVDASLYDALGKHRPVRILQRMRAALLTADQAALLEIEPIAAGLEIDRRGFDAEGRIVEFTRSIYRGDSYDYVAELRQEQ